jgi:hypothetical protein
MAKYRRGFEENPEDISSACNYIPLLTENASYKKQNTLAPSFRVPNLFSGKI